MQNIVIEYNKHVGLRRSMNVFIRAVHFHVFEKKIKKKKKLLLKLSGDYEPKSIYNFESSL